uniref:SnoaL-like domain-containing protein n=1 Tax=Rhizochromulina marina TaxID=1034831 RepID=A0A7S2WWY9_9STRA
MKRRVFPNMRSPGLFFWAAVYLVVPSAGFLQGASWSRPCLNLARGGLVRPQSQSMIRAASSPGKGGQARNASSSLPAPSAAAASSSEAPQSPGAPGGDVDEVVGSAGRGEKKTAAVERGGKEDEEEKGDELVVEMGTAGDEDEEEERRQRRRRREEARRRGSEQRRHFREQRLRDAPQLQGRDVDEVLQVHRDFYLAMNYRDIHIMARCWSDEGGSGVQCLRPQYSQFSELGHPVVGKERIVDSWAKVFDTFATQLDDRVRTSSVEVNEARVMVEGRSALVINEEKIIGASIVGDPTPPPTLRAVATSTYRKVGGMYEKWVMVQHHASLVATADSVLGAGGGGASLGLSGGKIVVIKGDGSDTTGMNLPGGQGGESPLVGAILSQLKAMVKKKEIEQRVKQSASKVQLSSPNVPGASSAMEAPAGRSSKRRGAGKAAPPSSANVDGSDGREGDAQDEHMDDDDDGSDRLQETIQAIRRLGSEGKLSTMQKSALLNDIIKSKHGGATASLVEVAFQLLLQGESSPATDEEYAERMADFVEQCRVVADQLIQS